MNEVEKMYENAGITGGRFYCCPNCDETLERFLTGTGSTEFRCSKPNCDYFFDSHDLDYADIFKSLSFKNIYPPFTAEKQIAIEEVILQNKKNYNKWIEYNINVYGEWVIRFVRTDKFAPYVALGKTRTEAFANVVNHFWQDLTDAEKAEIKNILESEVRE